MGDIPVHTSTYEWHTDDTSTYEWHTDDIRVHTSDIGMTYKYIRMDMDDIQVTYGWPMSGIRMTYKLPTSTCEWHTNGIQITCKIMLNSI